MSPKFLIILLAVLSMQTSVLAKDYTINLKVNNLPQTQAILQQMKGDRIYPLDTVQASANGTISFVLKQKYAPGMYQISVHNLPVWTFINNKENIVAEIDLGANPETAKIKESDENKRYYQFIVGQAAILSQIEIVSSVVELYPTNEDFYSRAVAEYSRLQSRHDSLFGAAMKGTKSNLSKIYASASYELIMPLSVPRPLQKEYVREHYFDHVILTDTAIMYSNVLSSKLLKYYSFYSDKQQTKADAQQAYIAATDTILTKVSAYPEIYRFSANFLMDGFEAIGQEAVADFIAEHYSKVNSCESTVGLHGIDLKSYNRTKMRVGVSAPQFELGEGDKMFKYNGEPDRTVVLIFWATWCAHCTETMPMVERRLAEFKSRGVEIVTVSLDTDLDIWKNYIEQMKLSGLSNFCSGKSWETEAAQKYAVYATPTFYVLQGGKIISKPLDLKEIPDVLRNALKK